MSEPKFHIIGISDCGTPCLTPETERVIRCGKVFSGGRRHRGIMEHLLPEGYEWIDVTVPLADVFRRYDDRSGIVVFASGDPLFYGYAATLQREFPDAEIRVYPSFNSLQMLAHRMLLPYQDMVNVSLTGRPWSNLDPALIEDRPLIGVLTDRTKTPAMIARRLLEYKFDYEMTVGENLGNDGNERVRTMTPAEAAGMEFDVPNCVVLRLRKPRNLPFGLPESEFCHLDGRGKMITKMPVRLLTVAMLSLEGRKSFWDVGFCTGSVSIEVRRHYPSIAVTSFEIRPEGEEPHEDKFTAIQRTLHHGCHRRFSHIASGGVSCPRRRVHRRAWRETRGDARPYLPASTPRRDCGVQFRLGGELRRFPKGGGEAWPPDSAHPHNDNR